MNIVFLGTPEFAIPSLKVLVSSHHCVKAVFTRPDKGSGRSRKVKFQPVKTAALELGLSVFQPAKVRVEDLIPFSPDLIVVVAFHQILDESILNLPRFGCVNVHSSLLPKYRGSSPINQAILNGDKVSGVTTMKLDRGMDSGDIYLQQEVVLEERETAISLHDKLALLGAKLLIKTVDKLDEGSIVPVPQNHSKATYAPMMKKADGRIDWSWSSVKLDRFVRAMTPWPGSFTLLNGQTVKIIAGRAGSEMLSVHLAGTIIKYDGNSFAVSCGDNESFIVESIQPAGKKVMTGGDFIRGGYGVVGTRFDDHN